jgi:assimilatory nitrate reductase catalytic subunit
VASKRGKIKVRAFLTPTVQRGQIFIPMYYSTANQLTHPAFDLQSRQPAYKFSAVKIFPM